MARLRSAPIGMHLTIYICRVRYDQAGGGHAEETGKAARDLRGTQGLEHLVDSVFRCGIKRRTENNSRVRFLSDEEERALLKETDPRFHPHLLLSVHSGIRMSEQYSLRWSQVDFERRQLFLPKTKNGDPRDVPLNGTALAALKRLRAESRGDFVFPGAESPRGWFLSAVERAGLKEYTWHCNRHTFASRLVMAGVDLHTVGELLGHRTAQMTKRYAHLSVDHKQSAVERISPVRSATKTATADKRRQRASYKLL